MGAWFSTEPIVRSAAPLSRSQPTARWFGRSGQEPTTTEPDAAAARPHADRHRGSVNAWLWRPSHSRETPPLRYPSWGRPPDSLRPGGAHLAADWVIPGRRVCPIPPELFLSRRWAVRSPRLFVRTRNSGSTVSESPESMSQRKFARVKIGAVPQRPRGGGVRPPRKCGHCARTSEIRGFSLTSPCESAMVCMSPRERSGPYHEVPR